MKGSEQKDIIILGKLQAINDAMNIEPPNNRELRKKFIASRKLLCEVITEHWDYCNELVTNDDT